MNFHSIIGAFCISSLLAMTAHGGETVLVNEENPQSLPILTQIEKPFVFIYGQWANQVIVDDGVAKLQANTSKGAAGSNENMSAEPDQRAILRITLGKQNKAKRLSLILRDASGNTASWHYDLTTLSPEVPTFLAPEGNHSLSQPHSIDKVKGEPGALPNFKKLTQWKLCGDWTDDALDASISVILLEKD